MCRVLYASSSSVSRDVVSVFPPGSLEDRDTAQQQETSRQLRDKGNKLYQVSSVLTRVMVVIMIAVTSVTPSWPGTTSMVI